jgi:hypothetical protein
MASSSQCLGQLLLNVTDKPFGKVVGRTLQMLACDSDLQGQMSFDKSDTYLFRV